MTASRCGNTSILKTTYDVVITMATMILRFGNNIIHHKEDLSIRTYPLIFQNYFLAVEGLTNINSMKLCGSPPPQFRAGRGVPGLQRKTKTKFPEVQLCVDKIKLPEVISPQ